MLKIEYSKVVLRKLQSIKKKLCVDFGEDVAVGKLTYIVDALDSLVLSSNPGESMEDRFGIKTDYRYVVISPNIFILSIKNNKIIIKQVFNEKEDFIYKMFKIRMRSKESINYWGE